MRSDYRSVLVALGLAGIWMMLLSVGVQAQTYGPPYVIGLRGTGEGLITQQGNSVAIDPVQNYAYALTENSVTVFSDTQIVKSFSSIGSPIAIAAAPVKGMAYVTLDTDRIRFIQGERLLTTTIKLDSGAGALATHARTGYAYLALPDEGEIAVFDGTEEISPHNRIRPGKAPIALAVDADHDKLYVANQGDASLATVDLANAMTVVTMALPVTPTNVVVNPVTQYVYVATIKDSINVISGTTIVNTIAITAPSQMAVNPVTGRVYVLSSPCGEPGNCPEGGRVDVEILSEDQWIGSIEVVGPRFTNAIEANPSSGYVYVAAGQGDNGVTAIIRDTYLIETFPMEQAPMDVAVGGAAETERAYVPVLDGWVVLFGRARTYRSDPISPGSGFTTTLLCYGTNNLPISIDIPSEAITTSVEEVEVACSAIPENPVGSDFTWAGQAFRISVFEGERILPDFKFEAEHPLKLTATYDESAFSGGSDAEVELRYQAGLVDDPIWLTDDEAGIEMLGKASPQISATIQHPGSYAVLTELQGDFLFLPLVMR